jgi:hypothetical protein
MAAFPELFEAIGFSWGGSDDRFASPFLEGMFLRGVTNRSSYLGPMASYQTTDDTWGGELENIPRNPDPRSESFKFDPTADATRFPLLQGGGSGRQVGSYQLGATAMPSDKFVGDLDGGHVHTITLPFETTATRGVFDEQPNTVASETGVFSASTDPGSGSHGHPIKGGDPETYPVNAYVHWIIRAK